MGSAPTRTQWLPYGRHTISEEDIAAVVEVLRGNWITQGPRVEEFERAIADFCEAPHAVAFSSGTAALHAACVVAGLGPGDEAITTPLTFAATANAIVYCGATPVFADICPDTLNINPEEIEKQITSRTKAILPVDFAGHPADLDAILDLARKHRLIVIEDACHALGAEYKSRRIGSLSHMTVFSFHPVKAITTGEGGMIVTNDPMFAASLRRLRHHGICSFDSKRPWLYEISTLGYNYRLSDIHSALGIEQFKRLDTQLKRRREIAHTYREAFSQMKGIMLPSLNRNVNHAWHLFVVLLNLKELAANRDEILETLRAENIGATLHYPLAHLQPYYREKFGFKEETYPVAEGLGPRLMTLPLFPSMTDQDVKDVIQAVRKVLTHYARPSR